MTARGFAFEVEARDGAARVARLTTPHGEVETPCFMPVGTKATVKAVAPPFRWKSPLCEPEPRMVPMPSFSSAPATTNFPVTTPIDPVSVPGWATIACAGAAM